MPPDKSIYDISEAELRKLAILAIEAKDKAYCPYSNFPVGASLLVATPQPSTTASTASEHFYFTGSNVEIASTPVGICAERCAIAPVVAALRKPELPSIRALAVSTHIWPPSSPCGMCRQFMREFCGPDMKVFMFGRKPGKKYLDAEDEAREECTVMTMGELLPNGFGPNDMDKRERKDAGARIG